MTTNLLAQRDPAGEVLHWLTLIAEMAAAESQTITRQASRANTGLSRTRRAPVI
jgi:hypothetical protein